MKKMEIAALLQRIRLLEGKKTDLVENIRRLLAKQEETLSAGTQWLGYHALKIEWDAKESHRVEQMLGKEIEQLAMKKDELNSITTRKKALESVKEKRLGEFKLDQNRRLQKQLDQNYQLLKGRNS